jgi:hypothetical protein
MAMNLTRICGCPKYPIPHASRDISSIAPNIDPSGFVKGWNMDAFADEIASTVAPKPPKDIAAQMGTTIMAKNIMTP